MVGVAATLIKLKAVGIVTRPWAAFIHKPVLPTGKSVLLRPTALPPTDVTNRELTRLGVGQLTSADGGFDV